MRRVLISVLVFLFAAPAAGADESRVVPTEARKWDGSAVAGPVLVDGAAVWASQGPTGPARAWLETAAGPAQIAEVRRNARLFVAAAPGRVALGSYVFNCPRNDEACGRYKLDYPRRGRLVAGPVGGPIAPVRPGCTAWAAESTADAVGWSCLGGSGVRDAAGVTGYPGYPLRLAGPYAAVRNGSRLTVHDRRDGAVLLTRDGVVDHEVDEAGRVAVVDGAYGVRLLERGQPERLIATLRFASEVRLAGDRIAVRAGDAFVVYDLAGGVVATQAARSRALDWDFDGERLAWLQQPCSAVTIAVRRLDGPAPPDVGEACTDPRIARGPITLTRRGRASVALGCPATARAGCSGSLEVVFRGRSPRVEAYETELFDLDAGRRADIALKISRKAVARLRRSRTRYATVSAGGRKARRRVAFARPVA